MNLKKNIKKLENNGYIILEKIFKKKDTSKIN